MFLRLWLPVVVSCLLAGCVGDGHLPSPRAEPPAQPSPDAAPTSGPGSVDILFMIDNSSEMTSMQQKLVPQLAPFLHQLESLPNGLPDIHVAVVSSDMGAPGDSTASLGCTAAGDQGTFQTTPRGSCTTSTLADGAAFVSNVGGVANYMGTLDDVLSCIVPLGSNGCGFEHQLAAVARALGADGQPPPAGNQGFLRPDAELAIFLLTNEDDCSAPADTTLYGLNGGKQSLSNPLGPIGNYRCNQFGHLCKDPGGSQPDTWISPPLTVPADATGNPPELTLTDCVSNDGSTGLLTPLSTYIAGIKALKVDPSRIVVGAITAPSIPYTVMWELPPTDPMSGELWPNVMHSCGLPGGYTNPAATQMPMDGSYGDPAVRVTQWIQAFGDNGVIGSVCDADYGATLQAFAGKVTQHL
jgi:hypothetical protein